MAITFQKIKKNLTRFIPSTYVVKKEKTADGIDGRVIAYVDKTSFIAEQFRVLRTNLYSLSPENPLKTIAITSTQAEEGKTITISNMAFTLSLDTEKKVVLIDADLRRPTIHRIFNISRKPGLSDVLLGKTDVEHLVKKPVVGNLYIIPSGTIISNPSEILNSAKFQETLNMLKEKFSYILFDTPPVLNVTDATVLGVHCDAVLLVVKAGVTQKNLIEEALNSLISAQVKPKACIVTNMRILPSEYYYYLTKYRYYAEYKPATKRDNV